MTHLELENLASEYLEDRLDSVRRAQVEEHLARCRSCQEILSDLREAIQTCRTAGEMEPPSWLVPKIRRATVGEVRAGFSDQVVALLRGLRQPRFAYAVGMAVFSISLIVNIAGLNLRNLSSQDLNPATWIYRVNRAGHLLYARAEKFYDDLRIVYEIESRFRNAQSEAAGQENQTSKPNPPAEKPASTASSESRQFAYTVVKAHGQYAQYEQGVQIHEMR